MTSPTTVPHENVKDSMCSIGLASALFDMSDEDFVNEYIRTRKLRVNSLHQLRMKDVMKIYYHLRGIRR